VSPFSRFILNYPALVSPPVALAIDVFARSLAEIGRADDEDFEALRATNVAERDDLVRQAARVRAGQLYGGGS
jgi:hypothetical protein